jgi:hypothetical protein
MFVLELLFFAGEWKSLDSALHENVSATKFVYSLLKKSTTKIEHCALLTDTVVLSMLCSNFLSFSAFQANRCSDSTI